MQRLFEKIEWNALRVAVDQVTNIWIRSIVRMEGRRFARNVFRRNA